MPEPTVQTVYQADLACLLCGAPIGTVESAQAQIPPRVSMRRPGEGTPVVVDDWRRLRCDRCGGAAIVEESRAVERYLEPPDPDEGRPRRGRPPKWLVEQRLAEQRRLAS